MVEIHVNKVDDYLCAVTTSWTDIMGDECGERIEIRIDQIPELIEKLQAMEEE